MITSQGRVLLALALASALVAATPVQQQTNVVSTADSEDLLGGIAGDCLRKSDSLTTCVKGKLFAAVDRMLRANEEGFSIVDGVSVVKTDAPEEPQEAAADGSPRSLEETPVEELVWSRVSRFLRSHTVKVDVKGSEVAESITSAGRTLGDVVDTLGFGDDGLEESGRKKVKGLKLLLPLLLLFKLKIAALVPLAIAAIALIAGKALLIGKLALVLAIVIGLKKLFHQEKVVTYEVVAHPHHSHSHGHSSIVSGGHDDSYSVGGGGGGGGGYGGGGYSSSGSGSSGGWGRSFEVQPVSPSGWEPQALAYRGQQPQAAASQQ